MRPDVLVGAWDLVSCEVVSESKPRSYPLGEGAIGVLNYSPCGTMSVAIMRDGRPRFDAPDILLGSESERAAAAAGYLSYAGRYELEGNIVRHRIEVSLFPNWIGTVQERHVTVDERSLTLSTDPIDLGGVRAVARMTWRRRAIA